MQCVVILHFISHEIHSILLVEFAVLFNTFQHICIFLFVTLVNWNFTELSIKHNYDNKIVILV